MHLPLNNVYQNVMFVYDFVLLSHKSILLVVHAKWLP